MKYSQCSGCQRFARCRGADSSEHGSSPRALGLQSLAVRCCFASQHTTGEIVSPLLAKQYQTYLCRVWLLSARNLGEPSGENSTSPQLYHRWNQLARGGLFLREVTQTTTTFFLQPKMPATEKTSYKIIPTLGLVARHPALYTNRIAPKQ